MCDSIINQKYLHDGSIGRILDEYQSRGYVVLPDFYHPTLFKYILALFNTIQYERKKLNYYSVVDDTYRNLSTINGSTILKQSHRLKLIYDNEQLKNWLKTIVQSQLFNCNNNLWAVFNIHDGNTCEHGWHVDKEAVVLNLMIDENLSNLRQGGCLRLVPDWGVFKADNLKLRPNQLYALLEKNKKIHEIYLKIGDAILFQGNNVLHSVSSMPEPNSKRVTFLFSWDDITSQNSTNRNIVGDALYGEGI